MSPGPLTLGTAGPHRPRQDRADPRADRRRHRPAAGGAARGISIELGYARLELPSGRRLSVIDVPGHERFVRTMVAGRDRDRPVPDGDRRRRRRDAPDARARRRTERARRQDRCGRCDQERHGDPAVAIVEASELLPGAEVVAVSARDRTGPRSAEGGSSGARRRLRRRRDPGPGDGAARRPRVHDPRRRDRRDRHAVVWIGRAGATSWCCCPGADAALACAESRCTTGR